MQTRYKNKKKTNLFHLLLPLQDFYRITLRILLLTFSTTTITNMQQQLKHLTHTRTQAPRTLSIWIRYSHNCTNILTYIMCVFIYVCVHINLEIDVYGLIKCKNNTHIYVYLMGMKQFPISLSHFYSDNLYLSLFSTLSLSPLISGMRAFCSLALLYRAKIEIEREGVDKLKKMLDNVLQHYYYF